MVDLLAEHDADANLKITFNGVEEILSKDHFGGQSIKKKVTITYPVWRFPLKSCFALKFKQSRSS